MFSFTVRFTKITRSFLMVKMLLIKRNCLLVDTTNNRIYIHPILCIFNFYCPLFTVLYISCFLSYQLGIMSVVLFPRIHIKVEKIIHWVYKIMTFWICSYSFKIYLSICLSVSLKDRMPETVKDLSSADCLLRRPHV